MMKKMLFAAVLWLVLPGAALAAAPLPNDDGRLVYSAQISATEIVLPYDFQVIEFERTGPALPEIDFVDTALISQIGSIALTFFEIINLEIIGIFLVLLLAVMAMFWLFSFVTDSPTHSVAIKNPTVSSVDELANLGFGAANAQLGWSERSAGGYLNTEVNNMIESGIDADTARAWGDDQMGHIRASNATRRDNLRQYKSYYSQGRAASRRLWK